jgi:hypothetical protein
MSSGMSNEIKLQCWVHGDSLHRIFPILIPLNATVHELKEAIIAKKPSFQMEKMEADLLQVWKVVDSIPSCISAQL